MLIKNQELPSWKRLIGLGYVIATPVLGSLMFALFFGLRKTIVPGLRLELMAPINLLYFFYAPVIGVGFFILHLSNVKYSALVLFLYFVVILPLTAVLLLPLRKLFFYILFFALPFALICASGYFETQNFKKSLLIALFSAAYLSLAILLLVYLGVWELVHNHGLV